MASSGATGTAAAANFSKDLLKLADQDGDNVISFAEFESYVEMKEKELYDAFCKIDESGDNVIQPEELRENLKKTGVAFSSNDVEKFIKQVSFDDDQITFEEFRDFFMLNPNAVDMATAFQYYQELFDSSVAGFDAVPIPQTSQTGGIKWKYVFASGISGACSRSVTAPLERIRVYLQLGGGTNSVAGNPLRLLTHEGRVQYGKLLRDAVTAISKDGGVRRGLWRGNLVNVFKVIPESMVRMATLQKTRLIVASIEKPEDGVSISSAGKMLTGAMGGMTAMLFGYPLDTVRTRMMANVSKATSAKAVAEKAKEEAQQAAQRPPMAKTFEGLEFFESTEKDGAKFIRQIRTMHTSSHTRPYSTQTIPQSHLGGTHQVRDAIADLWKEGGITAFYRGFGPAISSVLPYAATNLTMFEFFKGIYLARQDPNARPSLTSILLLGCCSGAVAETVIYPITVVRARMQAQNTPANPEIYTGVRDCIKSIKRQFGFKGFYRYVF